jgi:hypothetical protein
VQRRLPLTGKVFLSYNLGMRKPNRGRPSMPPGERMDRRIEVRATDAEARLLERAAELAGVKLSDWVRDRLRRAAQRELRGAG